MEGKCVELGSCAQQRQEDIIEAQNMPSGKKRPPTFMPVVHGWQASRGVEVAAVAVLKIEAHDSGVYGRDQYQEETSELQTLERWRVMCTPTNTN